MDDKTKQSGSMENLTPCCVVHPFDEPLEWRCLDAAAASHGVGSSWKALPGAPSRNGQQGVRWRHHDKGDDDFGALHPFCCMRGLGLGIEC